MKIHNRRQRIKSFLDGLDRRAEAYALRDSLPLILSEVSGVIVETTSPRFSALLPALRVDFRKLQAYARCQDPENGMEDVVAILHAMIDTLNENARYTRRVLVLHTDRQPAINTGKERVCGYRVQVIPLVQVKKHKKMKVVSSGTRLHLPRSADRTICGCTIADNWVQDVDPDSGEWCKRCTR